MEVFALTCTTCKSRLKVRDTAAIGQIMACPKCGGMVLIKPPEAGAPPASETGETKPDLSHPLRPLPPIDPAAPLNAHAFDDVDMLLGDVPSRTMVPTPTVKTASPAATPLPPPRGASPATTTAFIRPAEQKKSPDSQAATLSQNALPTPNPPVTKSAPAVPAKRSEPQRAAPAVAAVPAAAALTSASAAAPSAPQPTAPVAEAPASSMLAGSPWQYWAMVSASGLLGVLLAVAVVALTISWFNDSTQPLAPPSARNEPTVPVTPEVAPPADPENPATKPIDPIASVPATAEQPTEPVVPPPPMPEPTDPKPARPLPPQPMPAEADPLGLTDPPPAAPTLPANDPFKKFGEILGGGPTDPMPPVEPAAPPPILPPPEEEPNPSPTAAKLPKPEPRHIDVAARLAEPLPAIEIANSPLIEFLQVMQDLSTVPITLRPDGLAMVRFTPFNSETPVTWKGSSTTVLDAIQGALQPLGLEAKVEADQLIVDVASPQLVTTKIAVKDLTGSDERKAHDLAALLMTFVAPESWSDEANQPMLSAGKDELTVRQHRTALAECFLLVEKLRVARGLRPASKFDPKLFELTTRTERIKNTLATPITLNYSIPTPLLRVAERLGKDAKVRILFDWQSLAAAGWNPAAEVTLTVEKQTLAAALTDLTSRMDLAWRIVDTKTIQILSPQTLADRTELELHPLGELAKDDAAGAKVLAKIRAELGGQAFRDGGGRGELRFDAAGRCVIASLTQPQQQQVAALLQSLHANAPGKEPRTK